MRGTISRATRPSGFQPFTLTIEVENTSDLAALWARFNMSGEVLAPAAQARASGSDKGPFGRDFYRRISEDPAGKREVWKLLNRELKAAGISLR